MQLLKQSKVTVLGLLLMSLTLAGRSAAATTLYIDFNNNPEERAALIKSSALYHSGEELLLVPQENQKDALRLHQLTNTRDQIWTVYTEKSCAADLACQAVPSGQCGEIYAKLKSYENQAYAAPKTPLTPEVIRAALQKIEDSTPTNEPITLLLSGHFGGGVFTGNLGSLSVADLKKIFAEFPDLQANVKRLYLLGCYTNTYPQVQALWRDAFPNARVLAGFHSQSPRGESAQNLSFIATLMRNTKNFDAVSTPVQFAKAVSLLSEYKPINVALSIDDYYQKTDEKKPTKISDGASKAVSCHAALTNSDLVFYEKIFTGTQPIPESTSDSRLRDYYTSLRNHASCLDEANFVSQEPNVPNPDQVIRLILYRTVVTNFRALHADDLVNFDTLLKSVAIEPEFRSASVDFSDRKALIAWTKSLQERLGRVAARDQANKLLELLRGLSDTVIDLRDNCVPFSWVEPGASERSTCFQAAGQCGG